VGREFKPIQETNDCENWSKPTWDGMNKLVGSRRPCWLRLSFATSRTALVAFSSWTAVREVVGLRSMTKSLGTRLPMLSVPNERASRNVNLLPQSRCLQLTGSLLHQGLQGVPISSDPSLIGSLLLLRSYPEESSLQ
jgi:hypothetical protein